MKKVLLALCGLFVFSACNDEPVVLFTVPQETRLILPAGLNNSSQHFFIRRDEDSNFEEFAETTGVNVDDVSKIEPGRARLIPLFGDYNFAIIEELIVRLVDPNDPNNKKEAFFREDVPLNETSELVLFGSLTDLSGLADLETYDLEFVFVFRSVTTQLEEFIFEYEFVAQGD